MDGRDQGPRIAIAFQGDPGDPRAWSGVPAGLSRGLNAAGARPIGVDARFPGAGRLANALRMSWAEATASGAFARASAATAARGIRRAGVAGTITIGSGFALPAAIPAVTFEDMTVAQALRQEDGVYRGLKPRAAARWQARQKLIYERVRGCCVTSAWVARSIHEDYGVPRERVHVVGLGRNLEVSVNPEKDWSEPRFLFAGFDWERKRGAAVLAAFAELRRELPAATLDLVGNHPPVDAAGVSGHGPLPLDSTSARGEYCALLDRATCFLMPSSYEPFGIAYVDAGAAGVPSIGTTVGGAPDAVGPGGLLVEPGDEAGLLRAMRTIAAPDTARRLGGLALEHSALLTWTAVSERVLRALRPEGLALDGLSPFLDSPGSGNQGA